MKRKDEDFTKDAIIKYLENVLGLIVSDISEGPKNRPPDYYITMGPNKVALEVTQLSLFYVSENGDIANRTTVDKALEQFVDELKEHFSPHIPDDTSILLYLVGPVSNFSKYKKGVKNLITDLLASGALSEALKTFDICGESVKIQKIQRKGQTGCISRIIANKSAVLSAELLVLDSAIRKKTKDFERDRYYEGEKWLALLDDYSFLDSETYLSAMRILETAHCFSKIFLVSGDGQVTPIFSAA